MSIFEKFKKRIKKEKNKMVTIEEVKKLFEALTEADKKAFVDGLKTEKEEQGAPVPAPDEEKTDTPAPETETEEEGNPAPENPPAPTAETKTNEETAKALEEIAALKDTVAALREEIVGLKRNPTPADDQKATELDKLIARYNA
jgi:hypothetical protein